MRDTHSLAEIGSILHDSLGLEPPEPDVDLIARGLLDSLSIIHLITDLEAAFGVRIPIERLDFESIRTLRGLQSLIETAPRSAPSSGRSAPSSGRSAPSSARSAPSSEVSEPSEVLQLLRPGVGRPVFVLHTSWGSAQTAAPLARELATDRPIYALQAAYYQSSATPPTELETVAAGYVREVRAIQPHGPYALAGYSFGGLIAYEMAVQLAEVGERVDLLGMVDTHAALSVLDARARLRFRIRLRVWDTTHTLKRIAKDPAAELPTYLRKLSGRILRRPQELPSVYGHLPHDIRRAIGIAQVIHANYRPSTYDGDVVLFLAEQRGRPIGDPRKVWKRKVKGTLRMTTIPGEHGDLQRDAWVAVGAVLSPLLDERATGTSATL